MKMRQTFGNYTKDEQNHDYRRHFIQIFCAVDDPLGQVAKAPPAKLYPSEGVPIGIWFALQGGHFRAFCRWLKRDYNGLFGGLPDSTTLGGHLLKQQRLCDVLLELPSVLNVVDSDPVELLFPIRAGCTRHQLGKKGRDKGRWFIGMKLCWVLNTFGLVVGWCSDTLNRCDTTCHGLVALFKDEASVLADLGFRARQDPPSNLKLCHKDTWNERMVVETTFSLLTVVCHAKHLFHCRRSYLEARLAYTAAMFNLLVTLARQLDPTADPFKVCIAQFSFCLAPLVI